MSDTTQATSIRRILTCVEKDPPDISWHTILQIARDELELELVVRAAYKSLARSIHPDKCPEGLKTDAAAAFRALHAALEAALRFARLSTTRTGRTKHSSRSRGEKRPREKVDLGVWIKAGCPSCPHEYEVEEEEVGLSMSCVWCLKPFIIKRPGENGEGDDSFKEKLRDDWAKLNERRCKQQRARDAEGAAHWSTFELQSGLEGLKGDFKPKKS